MKKKAQQGREKPVDQAKAVEQSGAQDDWPSEVQGSDTSTTGWSDFNDSGTLNHDKRASGDAKAFADEGNFECDEGDRETEPKEKLKSMKKALDSDGAAYDSDQVFGDVSGEVNIPFAQTKMLKGGKNVEQDASVSKEAQSLQDVTPCKSEYQQSGIKAPKQKDQSQSGSDAKKAYKNADKDALSESKENKNRPERNGKANKSKKKEIKEANKSKADVTEEVSYETPKIALDNTNGNELLEKKEETEKEKENTKEQDDKGLSKPKKAKKMKKKDNECDNANDGDDEKSKKSKNKKEKKGKASQDDDKPKINAKAADPDDQDDEKSKKLMKKEKEIKDEVSQVGKPKEKMQKAEQPKPGVQQLKPNTEEHIGEFSGLLCADSSFGSAIDDMPMESAIQEGIQHFEILLNKLVHVMRMPNSHVTPKHPKKSQIAGMDLECRPGSDTELSDAAMFIDEANINFVMTNENCSRKDAIKALMRSKNNILGAVAIVHDRKTLKNYVEACLDKMF